MFFYLPTVRTLCGTQVVEGRWRKSSSSLQWSWNLPTILAGSGGRGAWPPTVPDPRVTSRRVRGPPAPAPPPTMGYPAPTLPTSTSPCPRNRYHSLGFGIDKKTWASVTILAWRFVSSPPRRRVKDTSVRRSGSGSHFDFVKSIWIHSVGISYCPFQS